MTLSITKAPVITRIVVTATFFLLSLFSFSQYTYNANCQLAYQSVISLDYPEARRLLEKERRENPGNLIPVYLENLMDCFKLFITEDPQIYNVLKKNKSARIEKLEKGADNSPYYRFCQAQVHMHWAFARLKFEDYVTAANELRLAHNLMKANQQKYPSFMLDKTAFGIIQVAIGLIPESYRWISDMLGMKGTTEDGVKKIREIALYSGSDPLVMMYSPEARFYLSFITMNLQQSRADVEAVNEMLTTISNEKIRQSPLMIYARSAVLMKSGRNDQALAVLATRANVRESVPFYYLDYLEGVMRLNKLDYNATRPLNLFLEKFRGKNYRESAIQRLAWISFLKGDTAGYNRSMGLLVNMKNSKVDEDKQAYLEFSRKVYPNASLLKARLLFDGGYYTRAQDELLSKPVNKIVQNHRDMIEYSYRLGRIYHESGQQAKALEYYKKAIDLGGSEPYYYAASAALHMGYIYEKQSQWQNAATSYKLTLSIETPEYKNSLHQKAKAGLERVKKYTKT